MNLLVSFKADANQRKIIDESLNNIYAITYIDEAPDRNEAIMNAEVILAWHPQREFTREEYPFFSSLRLMQLISAGGDHLPPELFTMNFEVAGNVGAYAGPMAEHVMAMVLALAKDLRGGFEKLRAGNFDQFTPNRSIQGANVAIIGFGGIGKATAALMRAFGARIFAINTSGSTDEQVDFIGTLDDLEYVLNRADVIVITMALSNATRNLIGERELAWMKPDAMLVNVARGEIIAERAFYEFLKTHPNFRAGIDAWWVEPFRHGRFEMGHPFLELPNVIATPHNSGMVPEAMTNATREAVANIKKFAAGEKIKGIFRKEDYALIS